MSTPPTWSGRPPSPPISSFASMSISPVPFNFGDPLGSPPASSSTTTHPLSPTPSHHGAPSAVLSNGNVLGPPTPAPSPSPGGRRRGSWVGEGSGADEGGSHTHDARHESELMFTDQSATPGPSRTRKQPSQQPTSGDLLYQFKHLSKVDRYAFLAELVDELHLPEALVLTRRVEPRLRRDFLKELPIELALYCLSFIDDPTTLARATQVSRHWSQLLQDERTWKDLCRRHRFGSTPTRVGSSHTRRISSTGARGLDPLSPTSRKVSVDSNAGAGPSFRQHFKDAYLTEANWLRGGRVLAYHKSQDGGVVTCLAMDEQYIAIGMADGNIHVFDAANGSYRRSLLGHSGGVWAMVIVSAPKNRDGKLGSKSDSQSSCEGDMSDEATSRRSTPPSKAQQSDGCNSVPGFGYRRPLLITGGCDRCVRVWDLATGARIQTLRGHTATVRCIKVLNSRPIAVSGSRDSTLRVWDIDQGTCLGVLRGHESSVRCLEVYGHYAVSGSYDTTCRVWNLDTAECVHELRGHYDKIYAVAFDGKRIVSGSVDSAVRVWDPETGACTAILQGHTSLVGQLQLSKDILVTGGSDGRVVVFDLATNSCLHRLCAHDNSVTCLQFDDRFIVSGGNDGRIKLWDLRTGEFIRELSRPGEAVWRTAFRDDRCVVSCRRNGQTVVELLSFKPWTDSPGSWFTRTT